MAATFLYKPLIPLPNLSPYIQSVIKVIVASEYLSKANKAYRQRLCWGSDIYTSDSDVVCVMQHCGLFKIQDEPPKGIAGVAVYFRVTKGRNSYQSTLRNGIRSKKQGQFDGCSIRPEVRDLLPNELGSQEQLTQMAALMPETHATSFRKEGAFNSRLVIAPPETEVTFNLSCEPAYKYSLPSFADYGCDPSQRTSNILQGSTLYLETATKRYELSKEQAKAGNKAETYRLVEVLDPFAKNGEFMAQTTVPLATEHTKVREN